MNDCSFSIGVSISCHTWLAPKAAMRKANWLRLRRALCRLGRFYSEITATALSLPHSALLRTIQGSMHIANNKNEIYSFPNVFIAATVIAATLLFVRPKTNVTQNTSHHIHTLLHSITNTSIKNNDVGYMCRCIMR